VAGAAAAFKKQGYVLIKMPTLHADYNEESVDTVHREIQAHFRAEQASVSYKFWRVFNSVNTAENRHSVCLPLTPTLHRLLRGAVGFMGVFLASQLPDPSSPLVELSAVIALPRANCQAVHTDIPFPRHDKLSSDTLILTTMLALKPITKTHGPTFLYEGSNTRSFHTLHRKNTQANGHSHYDTYGDLEASQGEIDVEEDAEEGKEAPGTAPAAPVVVFAGLDRGDVLVFDAKLFHFGGANGTDQSRDLLSWSFQKPVAPPAYDVGGEHVSFPIDGFTYHMDPAVRGQRHVLSDFGP
jgi:ectoine hydroxylase-related dioxygenase (phytanoyl-CoA dioxygenase family)